MLVKKMDKPYNFIEQIISGSRGKVVTRFPPEPNGYLHIGHAKSIYINFGLAKKFGGKCYLRFDDTNPETENIEYINAICDDIKWLGFNWDEDVKYTSDYFEKLFNLAVELIKKKLAYVDDSSIEEIRKLRGSHTKPGTNSPFRNRSVDENLDLFIKMKDGKFANGEKVLRAKIDMKSGNMNLRDPIIYRIKKMSHPKTDKWVIYPTYDFAHGQSDAIEKITHSICTLEFEDHRPLYNWFVENLTLPSKPKQYEFSRLNLDYTVLSKRALLDLVNKKIVSGWDDPRMPTIRGMRRRGYPREAITKMCELIGVTKKNTTIKLSFLEECVRRELKDVPRFMAVLNPLKIEITNFNGEEELTPLIHPQKPELGRKSLKFTNTIFIEQDDFMKNPVKGFHRLIPGGFVRLRYAYVIRCDEVIENDKGEVVLLKCSLFSETKRGKPLGDSSLNNGKKVKGIIHWVSTSINNSCEVRLYDRLFVCENPGKDFMDHINPDSLKIIKDARFEKTKLPNVFQFERLGYFCIDNFEKNPNKDKLIINKIVSLKDSK